jgi:response regulator RpfG family c-di-GMP phosphodiesterase
MRTEEGKTKLGRGAQTDEGAMPTLPERKRARRAHADELEDLILQLSMARGLDEVMAVVRAGARPLLLADGVTFVLREGDMCRYVEEDAIAPLWKGQRFSINACVSGWTMLHREPAIIEDVMSDERIPHSAYRPTFVKSLLMMPVRREDPVAAIGAYWARRHVANEDQIRTLRRIANAAAIAMTNVSLLDAVRAAQMDAERAKDAIILALGSLAETRDNETANHVLRTQRYVRALAEAARFREAFRGDLDAETVALIYKSAPLHDIGKVGIPDRILRKPSKLNAREAAIMQSHAEIGRAAIENAARHLGGWTPFFKVAQEIAISHHERWDGSGYPHGLKGRDIPLAGRLMAIADVYDALVSARVYKPAMSHADAVAIILAERGRHFDPDLIDVFEDVAPEFATIHALFADSGDWPGEAPSHRPD